MVVVATGVFMRETDGMVMQIQTGRAEDPSSGSRDHVRQRGALNAAVWKTMGSTTGSVEECDNPRIRLRTAGVVGWSQDLKYVRS